jgi:hypothetical protein
MVVNDCPDRHIGRQAVPAGVRLTVHHDDRPVGGPIDLLDGQQVDAETLDHDPILGPADKAVPHEAGRDTELAGHKVGQPHHAPQAVWVRVDVRNQGDTLERGKFL